MTEQLEDLYAHARETHAVVIGAGMGGLVSALEFAKLGMRVTVLEASGEPGGAVRSGEVAGIRLDLGAESFATRGGHVAKLIDELGLADRVVAPAPGGAWVAGVPGVGAAPLPRGGVLGIPGNPFADDVRRVIGWAGAWRAYADRVKPVLTIGHEHSLGKLVRSRLGSRVLDRLVAPVTSGVYSALPDDIDPDVAAPGLNAALTRTGTLTGAVTALSAARTSAPGGAVMGLRGGMGVLVDALVERLAELGVTIRTAAPVERIASDGEGWDVLLDAAVHDPELAAANGLSDHVGTDDRSIRADVVVVATDETTARRLIAPHAAGLEPAPPRSGPVVEIVTLVLEAPALDAAPRGTGVLTVPGSHTAKALTHATAKWAWVADAAGPGRHVVRVSFGSQGEPPATEGLDEEQAAHLALREASEMLGVVLEPARLLGARRERFAQAQPAATIGLKAQTESARAAIRRLPSLGAVGAWLSGTGLAQVVPAAAAEAERVRRHALFG